MKINKWVLFIIFLSIIGTAIIYPQLPGTIPTHWNFKGQVDSYGNKATVFITGFLPLVMYVLMLFLPKIDPKKESYKKHVKAYEITIITLIIFLILIHWLTILVALGYKIPIDVSVKAGIGLLLIIMGNYMSQIRHNYFFGIRTPWTLANETVWKKTHRLGAYGFIVVGLIFIISSIVNTLFFDILCFASLILLSIFLFIYSYLEYKKIS